MKKSFLILTAAALLGLVACNNGGGSSGGQGGGGKAPEIPVVEGKKTLYFELGKDSVELPSYCGYFVTGEFNSWAEKEAPQLVNLEGTNYWYAQVEWPEAVTDTGYQVTLGYTAESGAPTPGISWSYKSLECQEYPGLEHPEFEWDAKGNGNLGTHTWEETPGPVVKISDFDVQIEVSPAAPAWVEFYLPGDFNGWGEKGKMTPNEDRTVWTYHQADEIINGDHEGQLLIEYAGMGLSWGHKLLGNKSDNYHFAFTRDNIVDGVLSINDIDLELEGEALDLTEVLADFPDPETIPEVDVTLTVKFGAALDDAKYPDWWVIGDFIGWKTDDSTKFEIAADKLSMAVTFKVGHRLSFEFGICAASDWSTCLKLAGEENTSNFKLNVPAKAAEWLFEVSAEQMATLNADGGEFGLEAPKPANAE